MNKMFLTAVAGVVTITAAGQNNAEKPNFIVILLDDMGFADFGCYGGCVPTPNIDRLAQQGVRMNQMYNCARSCPTRASLLTGLYPHQAGMGYMTDDWSKSVSSSYQGYLNTSCVTIAEVMNEAGYFTAMAGKWHVGQQKRVTPKLRGFQHSIHQAGGVTFFSNPGARIEIDGVRATPGDGRLPKEWYATDLWTEWAVKYIDQAQQEQKPFMLYLAHTASHFPLQAPEKEIAAFKGQFDRGWDEIRQEVYRRQMEMGILGGNYPLSTSCPLIPTWKDVDAEQKVQSVHTMEIYAAMIKKVDDNVGRLVDNLKQRGLFDNTVIMLLSDNGGNAEGKTVYGTYEGANPGSVDSNVFLGQAWAEVSNTPFFFYKHHSHEGGITTGCVVTWPKGIPLSQSGKMVYQPGHVMDIMATMVDICGAKYPKTYKGSDIIPMQGISLLPIWRGEAPVRTDPIFWEHEENVALRDGKWKLVKESRDRHWQLYDMEADRTEMNDLSKKEADVMANMMEKCEMMYKKVGAAKNYFNKKFRWIIPIEDYEM